MANFDAYGTLKLNALDSKNPYYRSGTGKTGKDWHSISGAIVIDEKNRVFVELMGSEQDIIKTRNRDRENIEIPWAERFNEDILSTLFMPNVVRDTDRHVFADPFDMVEFLNKHIDDFKDKKVRVRGQVRKNIYRGKVSDRFEIREVQLITDESVRNVFKISMDFFYNKDSFDFSEWKDEKKITINGYTSEYMNKEEGNKYFSRTIVFDCSKLDFENEKHVKKMVFKLRQIGIDFDQETGKISTKLKTTKYYKMGIVCNYINGNEEVEFDESQLTANQKEAIELGLKTLDDFKPKGNIYGPRITTLKLVDFDLTRYEDGFEILDDKVSEFEEDIYVPVKPETVEEVDEKANAVAEEEKPSEDDEDLFG